MNATLFAVGSGACREADGTESESSRGDHEPPAYPREVRACSAMVEGRGIRTGHAWNDSLPRAIGGPRTLQLLLRAIAPWVRGLTPSLHIQGRAPRAPSSSGIKGVESEGMVKAARDARNIMSAQTGGVSSFVVTEFEHHHHYCSRGISNQANAYLRRPRQRPSMLWLSLPDPHVPDEALLQRLDQVVHRWRKWSSDALL